ncbi:MAG: GNAT family N-acetyltransferase, partial [Acidimicrobiales bacterium]
MDAEIRPIASDEVDTFLRVNSTAFGAMPVEEDVERLRREVQDTERTLAAFAGGHMVATAAAYSMEITVPGLARLPMAGVSWVGVRPTHRRRGLLSAVMRRQLEDVHARGEALAGLAASEGGIYGRFGYGPATTGIVWELPRQRSGLRGQPEDSGRVDLVGADEARRSMPAIHDAVRQDRPGDVSRPYEEWWDAAVEDHDRGREGRGARMFVVHHAAGGGPDGYADYRVVRSEEWSSQATVKVGHLEAATPDAYLALWSYLADLDLTAKVEAGNRPPDEPLRWVLADPRALRVTQVHDWLWLRLVDVRAALASRRYSVAGSVVVEVADPACPWNEGRWYL